MIRVRVLGTSEISIGRKRITPSAEVVFALGFYLCLRAGERLARDEVTTLLWGDGREAQSRHSLRQMLYRLRQQGFTLDEEGAHLFLDPARLESDVARMLDEAWPTSATREEVEAAAKLAPGFLPRLTPEYGEWLDGVRARVAAQHRRAALHQVSQARREGRWADLDKWALQVLAADPLNEEATLARAESAAMAGSKAYALEIIDQYLEDLGDRSVKIGLPAELLRRRIAEPSARWSTGTSREPPLIGRERLVRHLMNAIDAASKGRGSAVALWGPPGIGKTRLAREVQSFAGLAGFLTPIVRAEAVGRARAFATISSLVRTLRQLPGAAGTDPAALGLLERLTGARSASLRTSPTAIGALNIESVGDAILELFEALSHEAKVCLLVDDLHNCDEASRLILRHVAASAHGLRALLIGTQRSRPSASLGSVDAFVPLHLPPLSLADATALAQVAIRTRGRAASVDTAETLARASGGNPLFVVELSNLPPLEGSENSLPESLRALIHERLSSLPPAELRILRATVLLGSHASIPTLARLHPPSSPPLSDTIDALQADGLITISRAGSLELHECWHSALNDSLHGPARAALAFECAAALRTGDTGSSDADREWRLAQLSLEACDTDSALTHTITCAELTLAQGLAQEAAGILRSAPQAPVDSRHRPRATAVLASALYSAGRLRESIDVATSVLDDPKVDQSVARTDLAALRCIRLDAKSRLHLDHREDLEALSALAADPQLSPSSRLLACLYGIRVVFNDGWSPLEEHFRRVAGEVTASCQKSTLGELVQLILAAESGDREVVLQSSRSLEALEAAEPSHPLRLLSLRCRTNALRWIGESESAKAIGERVYQLSISSGLLRDAAGVAELMTFACLDNEDLVSAAKWLERGQSAISRGHIEDREYSFFHAKSRLLLQQGKVEDALAVCDGRVSQIRSDLLAKRRLSELSTIAYCAALLNRLEQARASLDEALDIIEANKPSSFMDYPTELALRTLRQLGEHARAQEFGRRTANRRRAMNRLPIPAYFRELRALVNSQDGAARVARA